MFWYWCTVGLWEEKPQQRQQRQDGNSTSRLIVFGASDPWSTHRRLADSGALRVALVQPREGGLLAAKTAWRERFGIFQPIKFLIETEASLDLYNGIHVFLSVLVGPLRQHPQEP